MAKGKWFNGNSGLNSYVSRNVGSLHEIRCFNCNTKKNEGAFSQKSVDQVQARMSGDRSFDPAKDAIVMCTSCRDGGGKDIKCHGCNKWKAKNRYSKQERNKDNARCVPCVDADNADPPSDHDNNSGHDEEDDDDDDSVGGRGGSTTAGTGTLASALSTMSVSDSHNGGIALSNGPASEYGTNTGSHWATSTSDGGVLVGGASALATSNSNGIRNNDALTTFMSKNWKNDSKTSTNQSVSRGKFPRIGAATNRHAESTSGSRNGGDGGGSKALDETCVEDSESESEDE